MANTSKPKRRSATEALKQKVEEFISQQTSNTFNYKQVARAIRAVTGTQQRRIADILTDFAADGTLLETTPGKYKVPQRKTNVTIGTFVRRSNGKNSVITDQDEEAIFVAERNSMHALNGDKVKVHIAARRRGAEPEAEVLEIVNGKI